MSVPGSFLVLPPSTEEHKFGVVFLKRGMIIGEKHKLTWEQLMEELRPFKKKGRASDVKTDQEIFDDMTEILRLKRIAEQAEKMFEAQQNAITPVLVAMDGGVSINLSPRDVGKIYNLIHKLSYARLGSELVELIDEAKEFVAACKAGSHKAVDHE